VFLFDATNVSNYPLLLFGQKVAFNNNVIDVDGFVKLKCSRQVAEIITKFRTELDNLLEYRISHPGVTEWGGDGREGRLLRGIVEFLTSEEEGEIDEGDYDEEG